MNKELFRSMQEQMSPSGAARAALSEKLTVPHKKHIPVRRYAAIAACAAVIIAAVPVYRVFQNRYEWWVLISGSFHKDAIVEVTEPHSYVLMDDPAACWPENTVAVDTGGTGDEDQDMTPGEVTDNMLEAGFTQEDVDAYLASGWQMTWAKWWKFYHLSEESGERSLAALLDFSQSEGLAVNTGDLPAELPGGAYVGDAPDQSEAIMAYQNLMSRFEQEYGPDSYPEWYGGAYIDEHAGLIVNIAAGYEPEDKELYFQIWDWAGTDRVGFGSSPESLNYLRSLQDKTFTAMCDLGLEPGCGINEETGQLELTLPEVTEEALWKLAELDPTNAILVIAGRFSATDGLAEEPALVENPVSHAVQPGGNIVDDDNAIAYEPQG